MSYRSSPSLAGKGAGVRSDYEHSTRLSSNFPLDPHWWVIDRYWSKDYKNDATSFSGDLSQAGSFDDLYQFACRGFHVFFAGDSGDHCYSIGSGGDQFGDIFPGDAADGH